MRITSCPNSCKRCFVTIPSATPVVKAYNSASSAELKLSMCNIRDHLHFPTAQLRHLCSCTLLLALPNRCLYTRSRRCSDFDQALCTRSAFQVSHNTLQIHLVTFGWTRDLSCCFLHAVHDVCSLLAHVQQFSHNCSIHCTSFAFQLNE